MNMKRFTLVCGLVLLASFVCFQVQAAASYEVFVGYADNLRPSPFFPSPFFGSSSVSLFAGQDPNTFSLDAGAIMISNNGATPITLDSLQVTLHPAVSSSIINLWSASLPFVLQPGKNAIFTQTTQFNFDTSDSPIVAQNISDNCSVGPTSSTAVCTNNAPKLDVTVDSSLVSLFDTAHVLDTGGFDANCCLPNGNESLQWRLIGTSGVENPGGGVPEPMSLLLLGSGFAGVAGLVRRRRK